MESKDYYKIINVEKETECLACGMFSVIRLNVLSDENRKTLEKLNSSSNKGLIYNGLIFDLNSLDFQIDPLVFLCRIDDEYELDNLQNNTNSDNILTRLETEHTILVSYL